MKRGSFSSFRFGYPFLSVVLMVLVEWNGQSWHSSAWQDSFVCCLAERQKQSVLQSVRRELCKTARRRSKLVIILAEWDAILVVIFEKTHCPVYSAECLNCPLSDSRLSVSTMVQLANPESTAQHYCKGFQGQLPFLFSDKKQGRFSQRLYLTWRDYDLAQGYPKRMISKVV